MKFLPMNRLMASLWESFRQKGEGLDPITVMLAEGRMLFPFFDDDDEADEWFNFFLDAVTASGDL